MKKSFVITAFLLISPFLINSMQAQVDAAEAKTQYPADSISADGSMSYHGLRIDERGAVPAKKINKKMKKTGGLDPVKVEGTVEAVCQMKGCWMNMKLANGEDMRIRFKDYGFFVPKDASGKTAVIEGAAYYTTTSVEDLRHYAEDAGMSEEEAERTITEPKKSIEFEATGVIIKDN